MLLENGLYLYRKIDILLLTISRASIHSFDHFTL